MTAHRLAAIGGSILFALAWQASAQTAEPALRIPLIVGLTTIRAVAESQGDYESIRTYQSVTKDDYRISLRAEIPDPAGGEPKLVEVLRRVPVADMRNARVTRNYYHTDDPEVFAGTSPDVSTAVLNDLRTSGSAAMTYLDVRMLFIMPMIRTLKGSVTRVGAGPEPFSILVNGRRVQLPVLHAKGRLSDDQGGFDVEFQVLNDPDNPLLLSFSGRDIKSRMTRIEFPVAAGSANSIERKLEDKEPVDVYGIYFAFGSATLRPESDRVLKEVADLLAKHRDWKLQVDGHTDNIGGDAANLDLSRRRAAAVKAALVQRFAIAAPRLETGGYGERRPKDRNDTIEGRALNRRVELRRL